MKILTREFYNVTRSDIYNVYLFGDIHDGAAACNLPKLKRMIELVRDDERARWIGVGDYAEFINVSDKRFSVASLAPWVDIADLIDLARAQRDHVLELLEPIADKCLGLICGNHELEIQRKYERDIYADIVTGIKEAGGFDADYDLGLGFYGWLILKFYRGETRKAGTVITMNVHHGFARGRLAGSKALAIQRWLWTHEADLVVFGHSHNQMAEPEAVEKIDRNGNLVRQVRRGVYAGTFLETVNENGPATYSEIKGYFPLPTGCPYVILRPGAENQEDRVRVMV